VLQTNSAEQTIEIAPNVNKPVEIAGTPFKARIEEYWPDFRIKDGKPENASAEPNNPCVLVTVTGHALPAPEEADGVNGPEGTSGTGAPSATETEGKNHLTLYVAPDGSLTYELASRKLGLSSGKLELNKPLPTGWADWTLAADQFLANAEALYDAQPVEASSHGMHVEGIRVRAARAGATVEKWVPLGWQVSVPTEPTPLLIGFGNKQVPLPIGLQLRDFQVDWNEGTDTPAGFKSTLDVIDRETGKITTGQCWMNNPMSIPDSWWNTFTGLTYKISQASWNPQNLSQSSVQILRDPGWSLKWTGSLVIVIGIFSIFYLRPTPIDGQETSPPGARTAARSPKQPRAGQDTPQTVQAES
jgi:hypothetical protein